MMKIGKIIICCAVAVCLGCAFNNPPPEAAGGINYYSKTVENNTWVDPFNSVLKPVETRLYDEAGKLTAIMKYRYENKDDSGIYVNSRTDVYELNSDGDEVLLEYYCYQYMKDEYQWIDDDGVVQDDFDYVLLKGETFSYDDVLRFYYEVVYDAPDPVNYDAYLTIKDIRTSDGETTAFQESTYLANFGDGIKRYRTEKYFNRDSNDEWKLSKEFACWYDTDEPYDYLYDLYHSHRLVEGEEGEEVKLEEFYYFTRYSRNGNGMIYEQADYDYNYTDSTIPRLADSSYEKNPDYPATSDEPFDYDIEFKLIKDKATVLFTDYDAAGNIIRDERRYKGELVEYTTYTYNRESELTDQLRYTKGGSLLHDRKTVRYTEEMRDDRYYRIKETCEYKYYDYDSAGQSQVQSKGLRRPAASFTGKTDAEIRHAQYSRLNNENRK